MSSLGTAIPVTSTLNRNTKGICLSKAEEAKAEPLSQLVPILLATLSRQSIQLDQMQRAHETNGAWRNTFDDKLTEIMSLLKSMSHTSSNQVSSFPKSEAPVEVKERTEEQQPGPLERGNILSSNLPELCTLHYFLSHYQASGGDQVGMLQLELEKLGMLCWLGKA
jgi:hypothetical protein